jgi:hypothetical protein
MPISPHLLRKLQETLGADAADDLVTLLEGMDANRGDIGELRHEMQLGFSRIDARFQQVDARFQQLQAQSETIQARMEALLEKGLREQTRFFFLAWSVLLAAIVGLYAR